MIDLLIGFLLGGFCCYLITRFLGETKAQQTSQVSFLVNLEQRIQKMVSDAMNTALADLLAAIKAQPVDPAVTQAAVDAKDAEDVQAVKDFQAANFPPAA